MGITLHYEAHSAVEARFGAIRNIAWDGMWGFLRDYVREKHASAIDPSLSPKRASLISAEQGRDRQSLD